MLEGAGGLRVEGIPGHVDSTHRPTLYIARRVALGGTGQGDAKPLPAQLLHCPSLILPLSNNLSIHIHTHIYMRRRAPHPIPPSAHLAIAHNHGLARRPALLEQRHSGSLLRRPGLQVSPVWRE